MSTRGSMLIWSGRRLRATRRSMQATGCRTRRSGSRRPAPPRASPRARPGASRTSSATSRRKVPRDEQERAEQAGLDADLGVVRLARLERDVLAERDLAGVAEPVALRVPGTVWTPARRLETGCARRFGSWVAPPASSCPSRAAIELRPREARVRSDIGVDRGNARPTTSARRLPRARNVCRRAPEAARARTTHRGARVRPEQADGASAASGAATRDRGASRSATTQRNADPSGDRNVETRRRGARARCRRCRRSSRAGPRGGRVAGSRAGLGSSRPCRCAPPVERDRVDVDQAPCRDGGGDLRTSQRTRAAAARRRGQGSKRRRR